MTIVRKLAKNRMHLWPHDNLSTGCARNEIGTNPWLLLKGPNRGRAAEEGRKTEENLILVNNSTRGYVGSFTGVARWGVFGANCTRVRNLFYSRWSESWPTRAFAAQRRKPWPNLRRHWLKSGPPWAIPI